MKRLVCDLSGVLGIAALLLLPAFVGDWLDAVPDARGEYEAARDAVNSAHAQARRDQALRSMCVASAGENSVPLENADGSMRCVDKHGRAIKSLIHFHRSDL